MACAEGHLPTAQWLASAFNMTLTDIYVCAGFAVKKARENGHTDVVAWLVNTF
jgi:ssRNA-specific RNase YbeY (16S rRNA maturation enzyme)